MDGIAENCPEGPSRALSHWLRTGGVILFALLGVTGQTLADPILVYGTRIEGLFEEDGRGAYHEIYNRLVSDYAGDVSLTMAPYKRAETQFLEGKSDCLFVGSELTDYYPTRGRQNVELFVSDSIVRLSAKIYRGRDDRAIEEIAELNGRTIAIDAGVGDVDFIANKLGHPRSQVLPVMNPAQGFRLLEAGRVFALVAIDLDVKTLQAKDPRFRGYAVSDRFSFHESNDVFVCHRSVNTMVFIDHINQTIARMRRSGEIARLLDRHLVARVGD